MNYLFEHIIFFIYFLFFKPMWFWVGNLLILLIGISREKRAALVALSIVVIAYCGELIIIPRLFSFSIPEDMLRSWAMRLLLANLTIYGLLGGGGVFISKYGVKMRGVCGIVSILSGLGFTATWLLRKRLFGAGQPTDGVFVILGLIGAMVCVVWWVFVEEERNKDISERSQDCLSFISVITYVMLGISFTWGTINLRMFAGMFIFEFMWIQVLVCGMNLTIPAFVLVAITRNVYLRKKRP